MGEADKCNAVWLGQQFGWCADLPVALKEGENHYCVFHAPVGYKNKSEFEFCCLVSERITAAANRGETCNLSGTVFHDGFNFGNLLMLKQEIPPFNLNFARFGSDTIFDNLNKTEVNVWGRDYAWMFKDGSSFWHTKFGDGTKFYDTKFGDNIKFKCGFR